MRKLDIWGNTVNIIQNIEHSSRLPLHVDSYHGKQRVSPLHHGSE